MCMSSPKMPATTPTVQQEPVAQPTLADAEVTKASAIERKKQAALAGRNTKTSARGLNDDAKTDKKNLLGE